MAKLLYVESSPRKERSHSINVAKAFLDAYRKAHPNDSVETIDLWATDLPPFDNTAVGAKFNPPDKQTSEEKVVRSKLVGIANQLVEADKLVFSVPMWNFGIPYILKHFIDVVTLPGVTFTVTAEGKYQGLLTGKSAVVIYARAGDYAPGSPAEAFDMQKPYMELWLGFVGITDVQSIIVGPTAGAPEAVQAVDQKAVSKAQALAQSF